ncbi:MAG: acyltransferase [Eubacteriales bacterium]|nr:acyltransferase [Eubacteriales bacterium]
MILSAMGILFVVDQHSGDGIGLITSVFPYGSFFMPMFMFISGYFWKEKQVQSWSAAGAYLVGKFKKLMVPYLLWSVFYGFMVTVLNWAGMKLPQPSILNFVYSVFTDGTAFGLNGAAWFVPTLFAVTVTYTLLRKLMGRLWNDTGALAVFILAGAATVALVQRSGGVYYKALLLYKIGFFIQFFQLGLYFNRYLEKWFDRTNGLGLCLSMMVVNFVLLAGYGNLDMGVLSVMDGFSAGNCLVPLLTAVTGIFFWLKIAKFMEPVLGGSKLVNYISDHTFFIMMHHVLFLVAFSVLLFAGMKLGVPGLGDFDVGAFLSDPWYRYVPYGWMKAAYFLFSTAATVVFSCLFDWIAQKIRRK